MIDIDAPWNISKIFCWISFFFSSTHVFYIELYDILNNILCNWYILRIGVLDWHMHCARVWYEIIKIGGHRLDFHLGSCKRFGEVGNVSGNFVLPLLDFVLKFWNLHYFHLLEGCIYSFIYLFGYYSFIYLLLFIHSFIHLSFIYLSIYLFIYFKEQFRLLNWWHIFANFFLFLALVNDTPWWKISIKQANI